MKRRTFLALAGGLAAWQAVGMELPKPTLAAIDRLSKWRPSTRSMLAVEWRYIAGRIVDDTKDYGFIVALTDVRFPTPAQELLVQRQDLTVGQAFVAKPYTGSLTYDSGSATYTFQADQSQVSAIWRLDQATQLYHLTVSAPELSLQDIVLRPQGDLIPEGGDGVIGVGQVLGFQIGSDYYADWTRIEVGGQPRGVARVDMQGLYLPPQSAAAAEHIEDGPAQCRVIR